MLYDQIGSLKSIQNQIGCIMEINKPPGADRGVFAVCAVASYFRIAADPQHIERNLGIHDRPSGVADLVRAGTSLGLKCRVIASMTRERMLSLPLPAIIQRKSGPFAVLMGTGRQGHFRVIDPATGQSEECGIDDVMAMIAPEVVLMKRHLLGAGYDPRYFGFRWFLPTLWRYRGPLAHVLLASFLVQIFALVTPLFFQVTVDKVIAHKSSSTLTVLVVGLLVIGLFDVAMQFLRSYALSHTSNRVDLELGQRMFHHLMRLPIQYFETRSTGQIVARIRELENIRQFMTGQGVFLIIDILFTIVFMAILFAYSSTLALIVVISIPFYVMIAFGLLPLLREKIAEQFTRGALMQQFLVEAVAGAQTIKSASVEALMQSQWEEIQSSYIHSAFQSSLMALGGQNAIQYVNRVVMACILLFGTWAVMEGELTVGELIAFNMIATQTSQPILRLSQIWNELQQVQISVDRLGDIFNAPQEYRPQSHSMPAKPSGHIEFRGVDFRYHPQSALVLKSVSLDTKPGEMIGIVGASGSGKSTIAKLIQRLYLPEAGQVLLDGIDLAQADPSWFRPYIGVVLQESVIFNRTLHDNIAFSYPSMPRANVIAAAKLAGADEFISKLPQGYDTMIEERGANLSGGQRQRIALARALAMNPPILILDEATSALDYESERIIQNNMSKIARNRTVIVIAHRLATVRPCKRIYGLVDGEIVEAGSHDELLKKPQGLYARLWHLQNTPAEVL